MTRNEYDGQLAVKIENTEGFTQEQIDWINNYIFDKVSDYEVDHIHVADHCQNLFQEAELALEQHEDRQARMS